MDVELTRAEIDLQSEEAALHAELSRLAQVGSELSARLGALQAQAVEAGETAIARRAQISPPSIDPNAGFAGARAVREAAVRARREANVLVRGQLADIKGQLQQLAAQVLRDEKTVAASQEKARSVPPTVVASPVRAPAPPPPPAPARAMPPAAMETDAAPAPKKSQRTSPRVKMQAAVDFTSDNNFFNGFSANISDGGLFVATVNILPLGTQVDLSFSLPSGERIEAKGVVQWVREVNDKLPDAFPGMGVQFSALHPTAQSAIGQFLAQRDPLFFAEAD